jgi:acetyl-CoA synthetase
MSEDFEVILHTKSYLPDPEYKAQSHLGDYHNAYQEFLKNPEGFWDRMAREIEWMKPWDKVLEWDYPYARWFSGGTLNITTSCLDRHIKAGRRNKLALIWRGEDGEERVYTYRQLHRDVMRFANALKRLGVQKGDRICFYMPLVPEHIIALLACARIGAVHSIVYAGFGAEALHARIRDAEAKVVITADVGKRRGKIISLRSIVDDAIRNTPSVRRSSSSVGRNVR